MRAIRWLKIETLTVNKCTCQSFFSIGKLHPHLMNLETMASLHLALTREGGAVWARVH